jgi:2-polyprenyl-6-methoxyphenol hydroxylase-like FAD-dependent oxidoreductase
MADVGRVLIAGGGIGGVAAAVALRRAGVRAEVFERAASLQRIQVGGCYVLWYAGVLSLDVMGLSDEARAAGYSVERFELCDGRGRLLSAFDVGARGRELGAVPLAIKRADLHRVVAGALDEDALHLGRALVRAEQDDAGVTAHLADGEPERGSVLVGADGIDSALRAQLHGAAPATHPGYAHWSGMADDDGGRFESGVFRIYHREGTRFAFFRISDTQVCWWCVRNAPAGPDGDAFGGHEVLRRYFADWPAPAPALLEATDPRSVYRRDTLDRPVARSWGAGRFTLLGDAAHAMTFNLGQGAGTALTDAVTLPRFLAGSPDVQASLRAYEAHRRSITAPLTLVSRRLGRTAAWDFPAGPALNAAFTRLGRRVTPSFLEKDLEGHPGLALVGAAR